jgi:hypothetical protein
VKSDASTWFDESSPTIAQQPSEGSKGSEESEKPVCLTQSGRGSKDAMFASPYLTRSEEVNK